MKRLLPILATFVALTSCTSVVDDPFLKTGAVQGDWASLATTVPPESALAAIPGLAATTVRQSGKKGGIEQTILYANATDLPGENMLSVKMGASIKAGRTTAAPTRPQIMAEMRTALAGVRMQVSPVIADNAYGVFGYATGSAGKDVTCVYAWQFARNIRSYDGSQSAGGNAAQIRLRYCNPGAGADRIVALMQGLRINSSPPQNLAGLGLPAGGGLVPAPLAIAQPFVQQQASPVVAQTVAVAPARRVEKPVVAEQKPVEEKAGSTIVNAAKVPLPGEAAELVQADASPAMAGRDASRAVAKPSFVPMPAAVASAAQ